MPVSDKALTWGSTTANVQTGGTATVSYSCGYAPVDSSITALLNNLATASVSGNTVVFTGVSAGTVTIPTNSSLGNGITSTNALTITVTATEDESYLNKRGLTHFWGNIDTLKQDKLTAGSGISISNNVISATGGGVADSVAWGHVTGTLADQTDLNTALGNKVDSSSLAAVATSGSYNDLTNKPTIPAAQVNSDWNAASGVAQILNKPTLAAVATSGAYADLSGTPSLATVATSGSYTDLSNKPSIPAAQVQSDWTQATTTAVDYIKNKPNLATVATSGSYNDLSNKPTIPAAQVNSDWDAVSGVAQILNKPTLATVATTGSYSDLIDQPTIPTVNNATLTIQKNGTTVQTFTANASSNKTANITVPTTVAELSDASNYATTSALSGKQNTLTAGDHISISSDTISAIDYVHSESPVTLSSPTPVVTGSMIASGTITASNIAAGEMVTLTLSTTDIGEGSALAANTLYGVYV